MLNIIVLGIFLLIAIVGIVVKVFILAESEVDEIDEENL